MLRKTLNRQRIGRIERCDPSADIFCHFVPVHVEQAMNETLRSLVERLVAIERVGQGLRIPCGFQRPEAEFVGPAKVAPGQFRIAFLERDQPQMDMGVEKVGALGEQPDEFVMCDLRLARLHHRLHLLHVGPSSPCTPRVHEVPDRFGRRFMLTEGELFGHGVEVARQDKRGTKPGGTKPGGTKPGGTKPGTDFSRPSRLCGWNPTKTRLQGDRVKNVGKEAGRGRSTLAVGVVGAVGVANPVGVARALRTWYRRARRDLPWRESRDPYRVWVSEIMLQQTQVERVKDFYSRFLDRFATVAALAAADEHEVLRLWEGLGYYRRARQLHAASRSIVAEHAGEFPQTAAGLRTLPGIGRYTAGAIASIAFDLPEPIVEANSRRVIARLAGHAARLDGPGGDEPIWEIAAGLVPKKHPGRFNQALMDLGAMICTPERPLCGTCPLASHCEARRTNRVAEIPAKAVRRAAKQLRETAVVARRAGRVLVVRRGPGEWWEGLWDFPRLPGAARAARRGLEHSEMLSGLACSKTSRLGTITHTVTHHRITLDVVECVAGRSGKASPGRRWVTAAVVSSLAMTSPGRRIAQMLG